jgi:ATP-dependent helicase/nuclease subunit B
MSLRIIYGRAGSGKTRLCLDEIKQRLTEKGDFPLILLVPEQFSLQSEKNISGIAEEGGLIRAQVLSFKRMAQRVLSEVGGISFKHIDRAGKCMILYRIFKEKSGELKVFTRASARKGFIPEVIELFEELKRYGISCSKLWAAKDGLSDNSPLKNKLSDIAVIFEEFEKRLHRDYIDQEDDISLLAQKLPESKEFDGAEIWIDGFSGFTPQEYGVIAELLKKARRVNVTICADILNEIYDIDETDVFFPTKLSAARLIKMAKDEGIEVERAVSLNDKSPVRFEGSAELKHLESQFFAFPYRKFREKTRDIEIFYAKNMYSEAEAVARAIVGLSREKGLRFRDMAVLCGDLEAYEGVISAVFREYDIPFFIDRKRGIMDHPLVMLITSALEIYSKNWSYEPVFRYLKTGLAGIPAADIDVIENYVLAYGIRGNRWTKDQDWEFNFSSAFEEEEKAYDEETLKRINSIRRKIVGPLAGFHQKIKGRRKAVDICTALFEFLCDLDVLNRIDDLVEEFKEQGRLDLAGEYGRIWNITMQVLDQVVRAMGDTLMNVEEFTEVLSLGFESFKLGLIPPSLDQVLVGSIERSKCDEVRALFIVGANDGRFPRAKLKEGILTDEDRKTLKDENIELAPDSKSKAFEEQYLVYFAFTRASGYLRISFPVADSQGRALRPSMVLSRLKRVFPHITVESDLVESDSDGENLERVTLPVPTFNELVSNLRKHITRGKMNPLWWDVYGWYTGDERWLKKCEEITAGLFYKNSVQPLGRERAKRLYRAPVRSSVSRMEKYASCPFSYFARYGLKARERRVYEITAPDLGSFMHLVIDRFSKLVEEEKISWRDLEIEFIENTVSTIVDQIVSDISGAIFASSSRYGYLARRLKKMLARTMWMIVKHIKMGKFLPVGHELSFGMQGGLPPVELELESGERIILTGKVDRADVLETDEGTYIRIIDYKSGNKDFDLSDVYYGIDLQLVAYLGALVENLEGFKSPVLPAGILYFRIQDPVVRKEGEISGEEIEREIMKKFRMRGLLLEEVNVIRGMDTEISGDSLILPVRINKDESISKTSSVASLKQFNLLMEHVRGLLREMGREMLRGEIPISPYKKGDVTPCGFCEYRPVCKFDRIIEGNSYRVLKNMKGKEIWNILDSGANGNL